MVVAPKLNCSSDKFSTMMTLSCYDHPSTRQLNHTGPIFSFQCDFEDATMRNAVNITMGAAGGMIMDYKGVTVGFAAGAVESNAVSSA